MTAKKARFLLTSQPPSRDDNKSGLVSPKNTQTPTSSHHQEIPGPSSFRKLPQNHQGGQKTKFRASFLINQDPRQSRFSHGKLMALQKLSCILTILIFFLACGKTQIDIASGNPHQNSAIYLMNSLSVCIGALIVAVFFRQLCMFELESIQRKVYVPNKIKDNLLVSFFKRSGRVTQLITEIIIILPHPCSLFTGSTFQLFQTTDEIYLCHGVNDLLSLLLAGKAYIIARSLLTLTSYFSPRASRLCHQNRFEHNTMYIIKCLLHDKPLISVAVFFGILMMICGYCLKLSEGVLHLYNAGLETGFENYSNCFWCIFITMSTIGYGDYYPKTLPGRSIIIITSIIGVFLSSILIVSLSMRLDMQAGESKSHLVLARLSQQKKLKEEASLVVGQTIKMQQRMGKKQPEDGQQLQKDFETLKKHLQLSKAGTRKIKSLVDTDNIIEEMSRLFYILKDNLKDIYEGQIKLKEQIDKIEEVYKIKQSFIREVSGMLSKPDVTSTVSVKSPSQKRIEDITRFERLYKLYPQ